jgi:hypothetical protein
MRVVVPLDTVKFIVTFFPLVLTENIILVRPSRCFLAAGWRWQVVETRFLDVPRRWQIKIWQYLNRRLIIRAKGWTVQQICYSKSSSKIVFGVGGIDSLQSRKPTTIAF